jgi:hypothetical protein
VADSGGRDFFISYTQVNRPWAKWIAVQLEAAGYSTALQAWTSGPAATPPPDAAGHHLDKPEAIVTLVGDRDRPGPGLSQPQAIMPAALTTDMPTTVARVLQEKP